MVIFEDMPAEKSITNASLPNLSSLKLKTSPPKTLDLLCKS